MSVYTARLLTASSATSSGSPYESSAVPTNQLWVVRNVNTLFIGSGDGEAVLRIQDSSGVVVNIGIWTVSAAPGTEALGSLDVRIAMNPGEWLALLVVSGEFDMAITGYQLTNY